MNKNSSAMKNRTDALDTLREWLKVEGLSYGSLKPTLKICDNVVTDVYISRGDETIHLRKDTVLRKFATDDDLSKPHI